MKNFLKDTNEYLMQISIDELKQNIEYKQNAFFFDKARKSLAKLLFSSIINTFESFKNHDR